MYEKLNELVELREKYMAKVRSDGEKLIKEAFKEFFSNHPEVEALTVAGWIPGYNDGEPCTFGMSGVEVKLKKSEHIEIPDEDDGNSDYGFEGFSTGYSFKRENPQLENDIDVLSSALCDIEDAMETAFGSNFRLIATPTEVEVQEYDCGY